MRCLALVDTNVLLLLYVLCCPVQGRLKAVLLCLRYVDTMAFGVWFVLLGVQKKSRFKNQLRCLFVFLRGHTASRADDTASIVSKKSTSPAVMFTSRLVLPSAMTWTEKSGCVANLPHLHEHTRARFLLVDVCLLYTSPSPRD